MIFAPNLKKISIFRISHRKSFLGSKNVALQFLNFLGSVAPVSYRPVSYKKKTFIRFHWTELLIFQKWGTFQKRVIKGSGESDAAEDLGAKNCKDLSAKLSNN